MFGGGLCAGAGFGGWLLMIGFWGAFLGAVVWAVGRLFPGTDRDATAEELLDRRLAVGEIDPETYRRVRDEFAAATGAEWR